MQTLSLGEQVEKGSQEEVTQQLIRLQATPQYVELGRCLFLTLVFAAQSSFTMYSSRSSAEDSFNADNADTTISQPAQRILSADAQKFGVGQNIGFVEQLVNQSAAAKQILDSDNAEAKALREQAVQYLNEAKKAQSAGDGKIVAEALGKAKLAIFQAIRLSGGKEIKRKLEADYKRRVQSVNVLLEAHKRVSDEKGGGTAAEEVEQHVKSELKKADSEFITLRLITCTYRFLGDLKF